MIGIHEEILDNLDEVIHLVDRNMNVLFVNRAIEKLSRGKIKKEEMLGKNLYGVFPFLKERGVDKEYETVFSTGKTLKTEEETEYYGEKIYTITLKIPIKDERGNVDKIITIIRDITELKKIERDLRNIARQYSSIIELAQEGICIDDENERIIFANEAMAKILGYKREELLGREFSEFVDERDKKILEEQIKIRRSGKASRYEIRVKTKDGKIKTLLISASPIIENGKFMGSVSVNLDITEKRRVEEELKKMLEREKEFKLRTAHYFFNPITIAKGYLYLSLERLPESEKDCLKKAIESLNRIEKVVKNIVVKGKIEE